MNNNNKLILGGLGSIVVVLIIFVLSQNPASNRRHRNLAPVEKNAMSNDLSNPQPPIPQESPIRIAKATFFLENSGSMFGYLTSNSNYVQAVNNLALNLDFSDMNTETVFNLINGNGEDVKITPLGNNRSVFRSLLNPDSFNRGNINTSDLTKMFEIALENAENNYISILVSDGLYDVGGEISPLNALDSETSSTAIKFNDRIRQNPNLQTLIVKLTSQFRGRYTYSSRRGSVGLDQERPYYIWIFGNNELLNKYFSEEYFKNHLPGYQAMARFFKLDGFTIPYEATSLEKLGSFRFERGSRKKLNGTEKDRMGRGFQFSIAADYSSIPYSDEYKLSIENYECSEFFEVSNIQKFDTTKLFVVNGIVPTHLISVKTAQNPFGTLQVNLKNSIPLWISQTNSEDETNIIGDSQYTFGFEKLIRGITDAYTHASRRDNLASFIIEINN